MIKHLHRFEDGICTNCDCWLEEQGDVPCTVQQHGEFILYFRDQGAAHRWAFELEHRLHEGVEAWPTLQKLAWRDMVLPPYLPEKGEAPHDLMIPPGLMAYWLKREEEELQALLN